MYEGKRTNPKSAKVMKQKLALLASILLVLSVGIGATVAYLTDNTEDVKNTFTPAEVPPTIVETFPDDHLLKQNVKVTNSGNVSAYIRAAIVVTWQDDQGNVAPTVPVLGTDYTMETITTGGWSEKQTDGYYYYSGAVSAKDTTGILIKEAYQMVDNSNYHLVIEILAQTIQSVPTSVVAEEWGVMVAADGTISK